MHSHPEWIARLWWQQLGAETARALMAADNEPGEIALRANTLVTDAAALARELGARRLHGDPALPEALVLEGPFDAARLAAVAQRRASSRSRARRCSWRARWIPSRGSACSTSARPPGARPRTWPR